MKKLSGRKTKLPATARTKKDVPKPPVAAYPVAMYPAKTTMHPTLRRILGEILAIELGLAAMGALGRMRV